jgi:hypothetical protein
LIAVRWTVPKRWRAAALLTLAAASGAAAQTVNANRLPDGGTPQALTRPGNGGVAGTGLGGSTSGTGNGATSGKADGGAPGLPGTGTSIKGPAGEGIDGQGRSNGISAEGEPPK